MTETMDRTLPSWATFAANQVEGKIPRIVVDEAAMYRAFLEEFAANPPKPEDFPGRSFDVPRREGGSRKIHYERMTVEEARCDPDAPTQYWLECAYQCMKLELQLALRSFALEIRLHDPEHRYALKAHPEGRCPWAASRGLEAKSHFKRLRGVLPG